MAKADEELTACKVRILELEKQQDQAVLAKAQAVVQHVRLIRGIQKSRQALEENRVLLVEAQYEVGVLKVKNSEITQQIEEGRKAVKALDVEFARRKETAAEAAAQVSGIVTEENRDELRAKAMNKTVEEVDQAIQVERAKLEVIQASNPAALEEYERYAARIQREQANQANQERKMAELNDRIHHIRSQWEPRLDELISRINDAFSYNFEQISCAGEVGVHKDEDFEKWAIEIKVKFR